MKAQPPSPFQEGGDGSPTVAKPFLCDFQVMQASLNRSNVRESVCALPMDAPINHSYLNSTAIHL